MGGRQVVVCEACWQAYPHGKERAMRARRAGRAVHLCQKKACRAKRLARVKDTRAAS